jgi:hypothetical protein
VVENTEVKVVDVQRNPFTGAAEVAEFLLAGRYQVILQKHPLRPLALIPIVVTDLLPARRSPFVRHERANVQIPKELQKALKRKAFEIFFLRARHNRVRQQNNNITTMPTP